MVFMTEVFLSSATCQIGPFISPTEKCAFFFLLVQIQILHLVLPLQKFHNNFIQ